MATATPSAPPAAEQPQASPRNTPVSAGGTIVAPPVASLAPGEADKSLLRSGAAERLPVELDVAVEVRDFRVRDLLALAPGQIVETDWIHGEDVPLAAGAVHLAWSEFEVVDTQLAVRITRLP